MIARSYWARSTTTLHSHWIAERNHLGEVVVKNMFFRQLPIHIIMFLQASMLKKLWDQSPRLWRIELSVLLDLRFFSHFHIPFCSRLLSCFWRVVIFSSLLNAFSTNFPIRFVIFSSMISSDFGLSLVIVSLISGRIFDGSDFDLCVSKAVVPQLEKSLLATDSVLLLPYLADSSLKLFKSFITTVVTS